MQIFAIFWFIRIMTKKINQSIDFILLKNVTAWIFFTVLVYEDDILSKNSSLIEAFYNLNVFSKKQQQSKSISRLCFEVHFKLEAVAADSLIRIFVPVCPTDGYDDIKTASFTRTHRKYMKITVRCRRADWKQNKTLISRANVSSRVESIFSSTVINQMLRCLYFTWVLPVHATLYFYFILKTNILYNPLRLIWQLQIRIINTTPSKLWCIFMVTCST